MWLSEALARHLFAPESAERLTVLVELSHPDWDAPQRLSIGETVVSEGLVWRASPVDVQLPELTHEGPRPGRLVVAATPRAVSMFRSVSTPIRVDIRVVFVAEPDTPVRIFPRGLVLRPRVERDLVHADVVWPEWAQLRVPRHGYTPGDFPGMF